LVFASGPSTPSTRSGGYAADLALLVVGGAAFLFAVILWFDNAQGGLTGNGVWKSLELEPWIEDPAKAPLYPANYFFYPVYGALCRLLDLLGVFPANPLKQIAVLNAASASLCLATVYALIRHLTGDRLIALIAALFHLASSFVLFLAITNEDIMPSYTVLFAAMALGAAWLARPSAMRVAAVSALFSLSWLFEWRLMFPTLPAMLAALWLCESRPARRLAWLGLFLAAMAASAVAAALITLGHANATDPWHLIWTGKAVDSVWAGFTTAKVGYLRDGIAAYLLGTGITTIDHFPGWDAWRVLSLAWSFAVAAVALPMLWRRRDDPRVRALAAIFGGTFVAGEIFNLYAQPQDPQMQINVMAWLTPGWALVLVAARERWNGAGLRALAGLTLALLGYNLWSLAPLRGMDTAWKRTLAHIEREADPARTVFLMHDFDWTMVYASVLWDPTESGTEELGPAPQARPKFKWIGFTKVVQHHPDWSVERQVRSVRAELDHAFDLGYDVMAVGLWDKSLDELATSTGMIVDRYRLEMLSTMLHHDFVATPAFDDPQAGHVWRLAKAPGR